MHTKSIPVPFIFSFSSSFLIRTCGCTVTTGDCFGRAVFVRLEAAQVVGEVR